MTFEVKPPKVPHGAADGELLFTCPRCDKNFCRKGELCEDCAGAKLETLVSKKENLRVEPNYQELKRQKEELEKQVTELNRTVEALKKAVTTPRPESVEKELTGHVTREMLLDHCKEVVTKHRTSQYGTPEDNFKQTALMWAAYLGVPITSYDVAALMVLLKVARVKNSPGKADTWVDMAGYAACGVEVATKPKE